MVADIIKAYSRLGKLQDEKFHKRLLKIYELENYTLLTPPYEIKGIKELFKRMHKELDFEFSQEYYRFIRICDGGILFTNTFYSILNPDDPDDDMVSVNKYFHDEEFIPQGTMAIGETNYGAYFVQKKSGKNTFGIWNPEEGDYIANFRDFNALLDYVIIEAEHLLKENALFEIEDN